MEKKENLVEEALIQIKNLENVLSENAKGILASTMKEEISELVQESLKTEQDDEDEMSSDELEIDVDTDDDSDVDDEITFDDEESDDDSDNMMDISFDDEESDDDSDNMMDISFGDDEVIDLSMADDDEVLKVFKAMGPEDGIMVKKDGNMLNLKDSEKEYLIRLGESIEDDEFDYVEEEMEEDMEEDMDENIYEIEMSDEMYNDMDEELEEDMDEDMDETIYEIEMEEDMDEEMEEELEEDMDDDMEMGGFFGDNDDENYDYTMAESKKGMKPVVGKGVKTGSPDFKYNSSKNDKFAKGKKTGKPEYKVAGGAKLGNAKFEFKETTKPEKMTKPGMAKPRPAGAFGKKDVEVNMYSDMGHMGNVKKETKEAARGYAFGPKGLRKGITNNRNLKKEGYENEVQVLREKNEEYRKALNTFREKLTEVAVFNANLAYATRLFTEHSTTKQEKINILRRFDNIDTLKESKNLYKTIKTELTGTNSKSVVKESIENKLDKSPANGSSINLIESKTYENPQFLRMKDLMNKLM